MERLKNLLILEQYNDIKKNWKSLWKLLIDYNYEIATRLMNKYKLKNSDLEEYPEGRISVDKLTRLSQILIYQTSKTRGYIYNNKEPYNNLKDSI